MTIRLYNSMSRQKEALNPIKSGEVRMYTCGPTVYNFAHIGNFRAYIFEDLLRRTLRYCGYNVIQVMNLTDVDDKTIRDSRAAKIPLNQYTKKFKDAFFEDIKTLRIEKAEYYPAATEHIPEMIALVKTLLEKGYAYCGEDGSVYYSIAKFTDYGRLSKIDMANQQTGIRVKNDEYTKDSVSDFALWKAWDENDGDVYWDSPWGKGRPGWHIECSAMSMKYLGKTFDIHTGGIDNMFPHHEDEIAQSEAANGCKFVNCWVHCEHLIVNGQKMAKSLGNFFTLRDLLEKGYAGSEIRWVLLGTHYRKKINFTIDACNRARDTLLRFRNLFERLNPLAASNISESEKSASSVAALCATAEDKFRSALSDDLNISEALAAVYGLERDTNKLIDTGKLGRDGVHSILKQFRDFNLVLGVFDIEETKKHIPAEILELVEQREKARKNRNFTMADAIRDQLKKKGWLLEDTPMGVRVKEINSISRL